jgi:hypothetical protein
MGTSIQRDSVLVVDDEEVVCRALDSCCAGPQEMLAIRAVDCLVLDYRLPDVRGDVVFAFAIAHQPHLSRATRRCFWSVSPSN